MNTFVPFTIFNVNKDFSYMMIQLFNLLPDHGRRVDAPCQIGNIKFHVTQHRFMYDTNKILVPVFDD